MDKKTLEFDKILNHLASFTISPLGKELVYQTEPLTNLNEIKRELDRVTELRGIIDFDDPFPIYGLHDIRPALHKAAISGNYISPGELIQVNATLAIFRKLSNYFSQRREKYPHLSKIAVKLQSFTTIEKEITRCINPDNEELYDKASAELARIRRALVSIQNKIRKKMESLVTSLSQKKYLQESVITIRDGRLVLMVKDEYRQRVKGVIHDQSATGATLFIEPMETLELNNQIRSLKLDEKREIEKILLYLTGMIHGELDNIQQSLQAAAQLDFIHAKALFSAELQGNQPHLNENQVIEIVKGKHPLLLLHKKTRDAVVPLDLKIGDYFNTLVITGPNAGGKTVALKTVGLLSMMVQAGLHIPVDPSSDFCVFQNIFATIGDEQSIENDLSTFSSHVEKLKRIVEQASARDLIIIDEIGTGTDPEEGAALAIAILEQLTTTGCLVLVSTHQGALKAFAYETERVENGSMEFNAETLQPTYRFRLGLPGSSYAFEIARRWGLAADIIDRARQLVGAEKHRLENLLVELEKKITYYQKQLNELSIKQTELDGLIKLYMEKKKQLTTHERKLKQEAVQQSEDIIKAANIAVEKAIKEIREAQASREAIKHARQLIDSEKQKLISLKKGIEQQLKGDQQFSPLKAIKIGKTVRWQPYGTTGTILSEVDANNRVFIDTGGVKIKVPVDELVETEARPSPKSSVKVKYDIEPGTSSEIDLRGMRTDEAIDSVDKFIEQALLSGLSQIYIIHGKGTGILRKMIHQFLDNHPHVKSKRLADWNQGGTGVTIVEL